MSAAWNYALEHQGRKFELSEGELVVGRSRKSDVSIREPSISRQHVKLVVRAGSITVHDLGSSNGTFHNGSRVTDRAELLDGDHLSLGEAELIVHILPPAGSRPEPGDATRMLAEVSSQLATQVESSSASADASQAAPQTDDDEASFAALNMSQPSAPPDPGPPVAAAPSPGADEAVALKKAAPPDSIFDTASLEAQGEEGQTPLPQRPPVAETAPVPSAAPTPPPASQAGQQPAAQPSESPLAAQPPAEPSAAPKPVVASAATSPPAAEASKPRPAKAPTPSAATPAEPRPSRPAPKPPRPESVAVRPGSLTPGQPAPLEPKSVDDILNNIPAEGELLDSVDSLDRSLFLPPKPAAKSEATPDPFQARLQRAGFWLRLLAVLIDQLWITGVAVGVTYARGGPLSLQGQQLAGLAAMLLGLLVPLVGWSLWGTTPGKRLCGLWVCRMNGKKGIGLLRTVVRLAGYVLSGLPLGLGFLWAAGSEKRGWHDRMAGTFVGRHP